MKKGWPADLDCDSGVAGHPRPLNLLRPVVVDQPERLPERCRTAPARGSRAEAEVDLARLVQPRELLRPEGDVQGPEVVRSCATVFAPRIGTITRTAAGGPMRAPPGTPCARFFPT